MDPELRRGARVFSEDMSSNPLLPFDDDTTAILRAARDVFIAHGVKATNADDIAAAAGVARVTLYRRIGRMQRIMDATTLLELTELATKVERSFVPYDSIEWDPIRHIEDIFAYTLTNFRESRYIKAIISFDSGLTTTAMMENSRQDFTIITELLSRILRRTWSADIHSRPLPEEEIQGRSRALGAMLGHFLQSLVLLPDGPPDLDSPEKTREYARLYMAPIFLIRR